jgi:hypothetical protein
VSFISKPFVCDDPASAKWLTTEEKRFIQLRLQFDGHDSGYKEGEFKPKYVGQAFTDWKVYLGFVSLHQSTKFEMEIASTEVRWSLWRTLETLQLGMIF